MADEEHDRLTVIHESMAAANDDDDREHWEKVFDEVFYGDDHQQSDSVLPSNRQ